MEAAERDTMFGHPKGLFVLFFTEMWERFSYYGMRGILVLYLTALTTGANPGMGMTKKEALALYGWYVMFVYVMGIPGGILADRVFGQKKAVLYGGGLLVLGHSVMAVQNVTAFYAALVLIVLGVGLLKPNISTMVGGLYGEGDIRRDRGFTIFYIGINVGAFLASVIVGWIGEKYGWHYGFGLAGIGMLLGQLQYMLGFKHLEGVGEGVAKKSDADDAAAGDEPLTKIDKDRLVVLVLSFIVVIVFWGAFEQAGGLMNIYTKEKVARTFFGIKFPAAIFQGVNPLFIMIFGTLVSGFWYRRQLAAKESSSLFKMAVGTMIMGAGFLFMVAASYQFDKAGYASLYWVILAYLFHTIGELCASPVALSFITKLAPAKYASLMMGAYFAATGFGGKLAALVGEQAEHLGEKQIFIGITAFTIVFGVLLLVFLKKLKALTHGAEEESELADAA